MKWVSLLLLVLGAGVACAGKPRHCVHCDSNAPPDPKQYILSPYIKHEKSYFSVLGIILAFDAKKAAKIIKPALAAYVGMCEAGLDVNVAILTAHKSNWWKYSSSYQEEYFCSRTNSSIGIQVNSYNTSLGIQLAALSRDILRENLENYDIFIYQEEDMVIDTKNVMRYINDTDALDGYQPLPARNDGFDEFMIGFIRVHKGKDGRNYMIEQPELEPICVAKSTGTVPPASAVNTGIMSAPYVVAKGNSHQASFVLTQKKLRLLSNRCNFFDQNKYKTKREYFSSFSIFNERSIGYLKALELPMVSEAYCKIVKLIPARYILNYGVNHKTWHPLSGGNDLQNYVSKALFSRHKEKLNELDCWKGQVEQHERYLNMTRVANEEENRIQINLLDRKHATLAEFRTTLNNATTSLTATPIEQEVVRLLAIVFMYNITQTLPNVLKVMTEYVKMCEAGFDVNVVSLNTNSMEEWNQANFLKTYATDFYCHRIQAPIGLQSESYNISLGIQVAARSRDILRENANDFDVFLCQESEIFVTLPHLVNYIRETTLLESYESISVGRVMRRRHMVGYLRTRRNNITSIDGVYPALFPICLEDRNNLNNTKPYIAVRGDIYQGLFILTKSQLLMLKNDCHFFDQTMFTASNRYFSSGFLYAKPRKAFDFPRSPAAYCNRIKLIPAENYLAFGVDELQSPSPNSASTNTYSLDNFFNKKLFSKRKKEMLKLDCWNHMRHKFDSLEVNGSQTN